MAMPYPFRQAYAAFTPEKEKGCSHYWPFNPVKKKDL
jgi:hypothetical protein